MKSPEYYCRTCGSECAVVAGQMMRYCGHDNDPIVAERTSVLYGEGKARESESFKHRIVCAILKIMGIKGA